MTKLEKQSMKPWRCWTAGLMLALGAPLCWADGTSIESITSSQQAGGDVVRIELSQSLAAVPAGFSVQAPPRVAIDLPGVGSNLVHNVVDINSGNVRSVSVAHAGDRSRVVLNLRRATSYHEELRGKMLLVFLDPVPLEAPPTSNGVATSVSTNTASTGVHFADDHNTSALELRDVDFRRGEDGSGRVVVQLPNNQVGVDIRQQGQALVVDFAHAALPARLRKHFDVADFGTPVTGFSAKEVGDHVELVVNPHGDWEHSAYQSDNEFVLEVRARKVDPNKLTQGPGYSGEKLSLNFQNIDVRSLLQVIADFTNFNVVTSDTVTGSVTLRLKDVPWDQALDIIMQAKGLGVRKSGNVLWIAPKDEINAKEEGDLKAKAAVAALEPLRTQAFQLNYSKATDVARGLAGTTTGSGGSGGNTATRILSPRGSVIFDARTNQIFVNDIPSKLEEIQALITRIDIPVRQVLIEARIVEASDTFSRSLGVRLGTTNPLTATNGSYNVAVGGTYSGLTPSTSSTTNNNTTFVSLPAQSLNGYSAASIGLSLFKSNINNALNLELSALEADGKGKIISSPRVVTADQVKALIEQGTELPYQQATSSGATAIAFEKVTLKLEVTPQITPEGSIILNVDVNNDSVGQSTTNGYAINTKHVQTQVLVDNGGTVVIGGIFQQTDDETVEKVPFLGDIPFLGNLFKTNERDSNRTELLVFLTPKVVTDRTALH